MKSSVIVAYYLIASYRYYEKDDPIISDRLYDKTAKYILSNWDHINHYHKHLLSKDMLEAGSYIGEYPLIVRDSAYTVSNKIFERRLKECLKVEPLISNVNTLENFF